MHLAAAAVELSESLAGEGVTELMADLDDYKAQVQQEQVARSEHIGTLGDQLTSVANDEIQSRGQQDHPETKAGPTEDMANDSYQRSRKASGSIRGIRRNSTLAR